MSPRFLASSDQASLSGGWRLNMEQDPLPRKNALCPFYHPIGSNRANAEKALNELQGGHVILRSELHFTGNDWCYAVALFREVLGISSGRERLGAPIGALTSQHLANFNRGFFRPACFEG